jgi:MoaA/NifB/PqqE/SkfB family radical SAM enzyme
MQARKIDLYYDKVKEAIKEGWTLPVTCEIDLSNDCCLDCSFCIYKQYHDSEIMSIVTYEKILKDLKDCGIRSITFTGGGEPLMHPRINEIIKMAGGFFKLGLITNGVLLDKIDTHLLSRFDFIRVSLNAGTRETYKKISGFDYYDRVIRNIEFAKKHTKQLGISFVVTDDNIQEISLMENLKVDLLQFKHNINNPIDFSANCIICKRSKATSNLPCQIASLIGIIGYNGDVHYCCQYRYEKEFILGNINNESFRDIWERRKDIITGYQNCPLCRYSNYAKEFEEVEVIYNKEFL